MNTETIREAIELFEHAYDIAVSEGDDARDPEVVLAYIEALLPHQYGVPEEAIELAMRYATTKVPEEHRLAVD